MGDDTVGAGHVFVVHGRLETVRYDVVIVPTDRRFNVEPQWNVLLNGRKPSAPVGWDRGFGCNPDDPRVWFISVYDGAAVTGAELELRMEAMTREIVSAAERSAEGRLVVAMPVLGIRGGAQGDRRGEVIRELLQAMTRIARAYRIDFALVTPDRALHGAIQHFRRANPGLHSGLGAEELSVAAQLGALAQQQHLALFIGAGVSMAAGLPSWNGLLEELSRRADIPEGDFTSLSGSPLDQAELISLHMRDHLGSTVAELVRKATQVSLAHALLAGLDAGQVVTTNYDELYERAVEFTGRPRPAILARQNAVPGRPWLLKLHGDIGDEAKIVLTRRSFVRFDANSRPAGSLLQSLMMTKHLLVVGTSMSDDNVIRLALEVDEFLESKAQFGTFVDVSAPSARTKLWEKRFRWVNCAGDDTATRVRQMEILLDAIGMYATKDASWLLDQRFSGLLEPDDRALANELRRISEKVRRSESELLGPLRNSLRDLGAS